MEDDTVEKVLDNYNVSDILDAIKGSQDVEVATLNSIPGDLISNAMLTNSITWTNYTTNTIARKDLSSIEIRDIIEKKINEETNRIEELEAITIQSDAECSVTYRTILQYHLGAKAALLELLEEIYE